MNSDTQQNHQKTIKGQIKKIELYSQAFNCIRKLYLYLPPSYEKSTKHYPVLYMHYGQHLFEPKNEHHQSWRVHETIEQLLDTNLIDEIIVVGIAAAAATVASDYWHYAPLYKDQLMTGDLYERFIVQEVKPFIDEHFRTLSDRSHTAMIGACSGATVTYNIAERHPQMFSKIGMLSPAVRGFDTNTWLYTWPMRKPQFQLWIDVGEAEGIYTNPVTQLVDTLIDQGSEPNRDLYYYLEPQAAHHESYWSKRLKNPLLLFFGDKGQPKSIELQGENIVGIGNKPLTVNPVVEYNTGFRYTELNGKYHIDQPQIITIAQGNRIIGHTLGETKVSLSSQNLETSRKYKVVPNLPEQVQVILRAYVPEITPQLEAIYFGTLSLRHKKANIYEAKYTLPRDFTLADVFSCGLGNFETQEDGSPKPRRWLKAQKDMELECYIERWFNSPK